MTPQDRAARERKQKIFVVVGGLFLLAMLAFQLPKLLGGSSSTASAAPTTADTIALPGGTPPAAGVARVPHVGSAARVAALGKITSFSVFARKDPFVQQVVTRSGVGATGGDAKAAEKAEKAEDASKEFATGETTALAATIVRVNGARQVVELGMKFPAGDPLFVLVAEEPDSKSVVVGIVGGAYADGAQTTTLQVGKPLTLVNTTTGARYRILLVSVGSGDSSDSSEPTPKP